MISLCLLFLVFHLGSGFIFDDDPCYLEPTYHGGIPSDPDFTTTINALNCTEGTFRWDYPKGHTIIIFQNPHRHPTVICFSDNLGGDSFSIYDQTLSPEEYIGNITDSGNACTKSHTEHKIEIRVDACPEMRYMGAVDYTFTHPFVL